MELDCIDSGSLLSFILLLTVSRRFFFCGFFVLFMYCLWHAFAPAIAALWSHVGKGPTSWLSFVMLNCVFVTFPDGILGQVWYMIVLIFPFHKRQQIFLGYWDMHISQDLLTMLY